jgi:4-amino-4-deoxy-L-arabinose transferase-like glycosyltransferase
VTRSADAAQTGDGRHLGWLSDTRLRFAAVAALAAVCLLGLLLRLDGIDQRTLFWDEAYYVRVVLLPSVRDTLAAILATPPSDPLYALLLRPWAQLAGTPDAVVRVPSTLFGAATAAATAWLAWELTRSHRVAVASALLVAIAPYAVESGQEASPYALAALTTTLALAAVWRWRRSGSPTDAILALILAIVASYSHYIAPAVLGLASLIGLAPQAGPRRATTRGVLLGSAIVLLAWAPWLVPMLVSWLTAEGPRTALPNAAQARELLGALSQYSSGSGALLAAVRPVQVLGIAAAGLLVACGWLVGADPERRGLRVVLLTALVVFLGPWMASALTGRWLFVPHLMLVMLPTVAVVAAAGALMATAVVGWIGRSRAAQIVVTGAAVGIVTAQLLGLYINAVDPPHGDDGVASLAAVLEAEAEPQDVVLVTPAELQLVLERYWPGALHGLPADLDLQRLYPPYDPAAWHERSLGRFTELTTDRSRAWVVYRPERDAGGRFLAWLGLRGHVAQRGSFPFADLYLVTLR